LFASLVEAVLSKLGIEVAQTDKDAFLCADTAGASLRQTVYVLVKHSPDLVGVIDLGAFVLLDDAFDSLDTAEEHECVLEPLVAFEVDLLGIRGRLVVAHRQLQVVGVLRPGRRPVRTLLEDVLELSRNTHRVTPVKAQTVCWLRGTHYGS